MATVVWTDFRDQIGLHQAVKVGKYLKSGKALQAGTWTKQRQKRHKERMVLDVFKAQASHPKWEMH